MSTFKASGIEGFPNIRKVILSGTEHIDTLSASYLLPPRYQYARTRIKYYLSVQPVFFCQLSDGDETVRSYLTSGNARDDRKGPIALNVSQESVVGILILVVSGCHNVLIVSFHAQLVSYLK
jgi:hypothetical protein